MHPKWVDEHMKRGRAVVYADEALYYLYKTCRKNPNIRKKFIGYISPEGIIRNGKNISQGKAGLAKAILTGFLAAVFTLVVIVSIFLHG